MKSYKEFSEERRETEIGITGKPIPNRRLGPKKRHEFEKKRRENLKKRPGDAPGESKLIQLMERQSAEGRKLNQFVKWHRTSP